MNCCGADVASSCVCLRGLVDGWVVTVPDSRPPYLLFFILRSYVERAATDMSMFLPASVALNVRKNKRTAMWGNGGGGPYSGPLLPVCSVLHYVTLMHRHKLQEVPPNLGGQERLEHSEGGEGQGRADAR